MGGWGGGLHSKPDSKRVDSRAVRGGGGGCGVMQVLVYV